MVKLLSKGTMGFVSKIMTKVLGDELMAKNMVIYAVSIV